VKSAPKLTAWKGFGVKKMTDRRTGIKYTQPPAVMFQLTFPLTKKGGETVSTHSKNMRKSKLDHFPNFRGEKNKIFEVSPPS